MARDSPSDQRPRAPETRAEAAASEQTASANDSSANSHGDGREHDQGFEHDRIARPFIAIIVASLVLYFAKDILLPLAMAGILALVCSPIIDRLERFVGRLVSAVLVVVIALTAVAALGYFLTFELTSVAVELTAYSDNIASKLSALQKKTPAWLQQVENATREVEQQVEHSWSGHRGASRTVTAAPAPSPMREMIKPALPLLAGAAEGLLVVVLLFFLLYERRALRARFVRLAARARVTIAVEAMDTAGEIVSHYLLLYSLLNIGFGAAIAVVTWLFGLPHPWFWGVLAFLFRFIPYVGAAASALLPTAVAFAVSPGWGTAFEILGVFVALDQILAQFVEPIVIGHGIGVSAVALLISAMYWAWLWGPPGLILSVPMTVCLKIAGDFIPALNFFSLLLSADDPNEDYRDFYRSLLEHDEDSARALAVRHSHEYGLENTFNKFVTPAVLLAAEERAGDHISEELGRFVIDTSQALVVQLGSRLSAAPSASAPRALGLFPPGEQHTLGLIMLLQLLKRNGVAAQFLSASSEIEKIRSCARDYSADFICISCTMEENVDSALQIVHTLRRDLPETAVIAGGRAALAAARRFLDAGCRQVCRNRSDAIRWFRLMRPSIIAASLRRAKQRGSSSPGAGSVQRPPDSGSNRLSTG
ncbi:MAG TPA: AI-2E family transporter [Candidatus Binataceae bacterium]|nr:AI-2E family transporter [Candidatus Binataceae bacterium]